MNEGIAQIYATISGGQYLQEVHAGSCAPWTCFVARKEGAEAAVNHEEEITCACVACVALDVGQGDLAMAAATGGGQLTVVDRLAMEF